MEWAGLIVVIPLLLMTGRVAAVEPAADLVAAGRAIYLEGRLPSGEAVKARREGGAMLSGSAAACVQCHQFSGMGLAEGSLVIPPVTAPVLFRNQLPDGHIPRRAPGMRFTDYPSRTRAPYDETGLARAIRTGESPAGHVFSPLMPRYDLTDDAMQALIAYLRSLSAQPSPGADARVAHFATVVAPDVDPGRRDAMLGVLKACFAERYPDASAPGSDDVERQAWRLHVWALEGPPETWQQQLASYYARQPVFALVSGLGADEWSPVEGFCESQGLPCLFPNAQPPLASAAGRYSFYFSRGLGLEADVFVLQLKAYQSSRKRPGRIVQLISGEEIGQRAAAALAQTLADAGIAVETWRLETHAHGLSGLKQDDALVLWLSAGELDHLMRRVPTPPAVGEVLVSGILSGLEDAPLNPAWRKVAALAYPFDPPARWQLRMQRNLRPWLDRHQLPRQDERLQGNTLAACNLLAESMLRLRGNHLRDYLVEWVENYPTAMGNAPAPQAYPRFSLGPGQRFSSKGVYLVRFAGENGRRIEPLQQDWIVP